MTAGDDGGSKGVDQGVTPWTTTVTIRWRPTPRVYDCRVSLLTSLEDQKRLRGFNIEDDIARAMIIEGAELALTPAAISVAFANSSPDAAMLLPILDLVLDMVKPRVTRYSARFQHLLAINNFTDYDQARAAVATKIFGKLGNELSLMDSAILMDGSLNGDDPTFTVEFGVVDKAEAIERLGKPVGRVSAADEPDFSHVDWEEQSPPDVALYIDSRWHDHEEKPVDLSGQWLFDHLEGYQTSADALASKLLNYVTSD